MPALICKRFKTRVIDIGGVSMGGDYPIRVQSMTNTDTLNTKATVAQAVRMIEAGCEYVRIAIPGMKEAETLKGIRKLLRKEGFDTPIIADVHFNPAIAEFAARFVEKVRINPGNYIDRKGRQTDPGYWMNDINYNRELHVISDKLAPFLRICRENGTAVRIGVNHGSLSERIRTRYGDTPKGMVESALEFARICDHHGFSNLVLSLKASNTRVMIQSNRMLVKEMKSAGMDYPLHLGLTEAGSGEDGRLKSAVGIGSLLADGIGDTIRVSITEDPEFEIPVAYGILQATGVRITRTEFISCPSCARTLFNIQEAVEDVKAATGHLKGLKIAVMGCIVNGPGEMADANYGYVGGAKGKVMLYKGQYLLRKNIPESNAVKELIKLIKENGDWVDPVNA
ncbi:MAG: (E)-4-hydroxy-3-methylbut-2-enyl-diphosphate synthase [Bacteroidetes bacterium]|nr:(E)-4-hydroxy-3-methylbut-2-enyl-diphosphate synthase [Bacteroidota bacterium]